MSETEVVPVAAMAGIEPSSKYSTLQEYVPRDRRLVVNWPGLISIAGDRGYFPGCRLVSFANDCCPQGLSIEDADALLRQLEKASWVGVTSADQLNTFAQYRGNLAIVDWRIDNSGRIHCLITTQLDGENLEDFQEAGRILEIEMRRLREERAAKAAEQVEAASKKQADDAEVMVLGRKAKEHNLLGKLRELEEENFDLKRRIKNAVEFAEMAVAGKKP